MPNFKGTITVIGTVWLSLTACEPVSEDASQSQASTEPTESSESLIQRPDFKSALYRMLKVGCYLERLNVDSSGAYVLHDRTWVAETPQDCQSFALSQYAGDGPDFLRLIVRQNPWTQEALSSDIAAPSASRAYRFVYSKDGTTLSTVGVKELLSSSNCLLVSYFGVEVYCFNAVTGSQGKPENYAAIIRPLLMMKIGAHDGYYDPVVAVRPNDDPFRRVVKWNVRYVDATQKTPVMPLQLTYGPVDSMKCINSYGANFQFRQRARLRLRVDIPVLRNTFPAPEPVLAAMPAQATVFWCSKTSAEALPGLKSIMAKASDAGMVYHEAIHRYGGHNDDIGCQAADGNTANVDWGLVSTYGAHIAYYFGSALSPHFSCAERQVFWDLAILFSKRHVCAGAIDQYVDKMMQSPNRPELACQ
jgi:hypothetical protein